MKFGDVYEFSYSHGDMVWQVMVIGDREMHLADEMSWVIVIRDDKYPEEVGQDATYGIAELHKARKVS